MTVVQGHHRGVHYSGEHVVEQLSCDADDGAFLLAVGVGGMPAGRATVPPAPNARVDSPAGRSTGCYPDRYPLGITGRSRFCLVQGP